MSVDIRTSLD